MGFSGRPGYWTYVFKVPAAAEVGMISQVWVFASARDDAGQRGLGDPRGSGGCAWGRYPRWPVPGRCCVLMAPPGCWGAVRQLVPPPGGAIFAFLGGAVDHAALLAWHPSRAFPKVRGRGRLHPIPIPIFILYI